MTGDPVLTFGSYRLDVGNEQLWCDEQLVRLTPKSWQVLRILVERAGRLVTKGEFFQVVWTETVVSDAALTSCIQELRQALGDNARTPQYIETVHRRGFRFIAPVSIAQPVASSEYSGVSDPEGVCSQPPVVSSPPPLLQEPELTTQNPPASRFRRSWVMASVLFLAGAVLTVHYLSRPILSPQSSVLGTEEAPLPLPLPDKPSILVLPFVNLSGDPTQEYFSDGMTEEITAALSRISSLFVIARTSAFTYKDKPTKVQDISREMGVRYVLEGSARKVDEQVRIVAQLIDATTGEHVWSERYDRLFKDIFALQDEIVQKIVTTLKLQLTLQEQGFIVRKHTNNLEAYDTFLRGAEYFWRLTKEDNVQARPFFEKAVALDPQYAEAYAYLGLTYAIAWQMGWSRDPQHLQHGFELAQQAVALDDSLPWAYQTLSFVYFSTNQYEPAVAAAERAIALAPNNADGYAALANVLCIFEEKPAEAVELMNKAMRLNPRYPFWYANQLAWSYRLVGRYQEAITALKQSLRRNPNWLFSYSELSVNYLLLWRSQQSHDPQTLDQALEAAQRAVTLAASSPFGHLALSLTYLWKKQYEQALAKTEQLLALNRPVPVFYTVSAGILTAVGQFEKASQSVEKALSLNTRLRPNDFRQLGHTYYLTGRTEEAITALKRSLLDTPIDFDAHLLLAAVYSELGRDAEAHAEAAEVLRINPNWSLEVWKQRAPYKDPAMLEQVYTALHKAGLK